MMQYMEESNQDPSAFASVQPSKMGCTVVKAAPCCESRRAVVGGVDLAPVEIAHLTEGRRIRCGAVNATMEGKYNSKPRPWPWLSPQQRRSSPFSFLTKRLRWKAAPTRSVVPNFVFLFYVLLILMFLSLSRSPPAI